MKTVVVCGMPDEAEVLTRALPGFLILSGTAKLNLPKLVPPDCTRIVSMGLCGGLAPGLNVGDCVVASRLIDHADQIDIADPVWTSRVRTAAINHGIGVKAVSYYSSGVLDEADSVPQRAQLFQKYGTQAIDDESRYVAALASQRHIPFGVLRSVSDDASETLPLSATGPIMNRDGSANISYLLWSLGQNQGADSTSLFRVALDFKKSLDALEAVAAAVREVLAS